MTTKIQSQITPRKEYQVCQPSIYQQEILDILDEYLDVYNPKKTRAIIIDAKAGTGKSTTISLICSKLMQKKVSPQQCLVVVFGKKNKEDLTNKITKLAGIEWEKQIKTLHSVGYQIYREALAVRANKVYVNNFKYSNIAQEFGYIASKGEDGSLVAEGYITEDRAFLKLIDLFRMSLLDFIPHNLLYLATTQGIPVKTKSATFLVKAIEKVINHGTSLALTQNEIDMEDMIYIPVSQFNKNNPNFVTAFMTNSKQIILNDEAQDTSQGQFQMIQLLSNNSTIVVPVGDQYQEIYSWRTGMVNGMSKWADIYNSETKELPINYRCGSAHIKAVKNIFPHINIQVPEGKAAGSIEAIKSGELVDKILETLDQGLTYLGISRKNSDLVKAAIECLSREIPASIKDKDLGSKIVTQVKKICGLQAYKPTTFVECCELYLRAKRADLMSLANGEVEYMAIEDMVSAVRAIFDQYRPTTLNDWKNICKKIFDTSSMSPVQFNTIHGSKGLEAEVLMFLNSTGVPLSWKSMTATQHQEEMNLIYIALTRVKVTDNPASGKLYLVGQGNYPTWWG